jgi:hypothetical protein
MDLILNAGRYLVGVIDKGIHHFKKKYLYNENVYSIVYSCFVQNNFVLNWQIQ